MLKKLPLLLILFSSICISQSSNLEGTWTTRNVDSLFTLQFSDIGNGEIRGHFKKEIISQNDEVYNSAALPTWMIFTNENSSVSFIEGKKYFGVFHDLAVTTGNAGNNLSQNILLDFTFQIISMQSSGLGSPTGVLKLKKSSGIEKEPPVPIRFPSGLTFTKQ